MSCRSAHTGSGQPDGPGVARTRPRSGPPGQGRPVMRIARLTIIQLVLAALSCWSFWAQTMYRTPGPYLGVMLALVSLATTILIFVFWIHAAFVGVGATSAQRGAARAHQALGLVI